MHNNISVSNQESNNCVKVLMVEDNVNYGELIKNNLQSLKNEKFEVILSSSLKEGLNELKNDIDIVLLDLNLPDSSQMNTFLKVKNNSPNVPIIILTSMDNEEIAIKSIQMGAQDYILKDKISDDLIVKSIYYSLERSKITRELEIQKMNVEHAYSQLRSQSTQLIQSEKINTVGKLVAGIAHGLNNPLMGVINSIQFLLEKTSEDHEDREVLRMAEEASQRCIDIVNNLQNIANLQIKDSEFSIESLPIILDQVVYLLNYRIKNENINLIQIIPDNIPLFWMKTNHIQQVFLSILNNSIDALKNSEIKEIVLEVKIEGEFVNTMISDTGCGISSDNLEKIFDPFFTTKSSEGSSGLGLSICKNIIQDHSGKISCVSKAEVGTTIFLSLPLEKRKNTGVQA